MPKQKRRRGFAGMSPARRKQIARKGAYTLHLKGLAHEFTKEEAVAAGQQSGRVRRGEENNGET